MKFFSRPSVLFAGLALCYGVGASELARRFPTINTDEVVTAVHGRNLLAGEGQRYSLYDDVFAPSVYALRDVFPDVSKTLYNGWVGLWLGFLGKSYFYARFSSLCAGLLALVTFYRLGVLWGGGALGLAMMGAVLVNPVFVLGSCVVRPEIVLLSSAALQMWLAMVIPDRFVWKSFLLGTWSGLQLSIHQNAVPLFFGFAGFFLLVSPQHRRLLSGFLLGAGCVAGVILGLWPVDLVKFSVGQKLFYYDLYKPPILTWPWTPGRWILDTFISFVNGNTFYLRDSMRGWKEALGLYGGGMLLLGMVVGVGFHRKAFDPFQSALIKALTVGGVLTLVGMAFFVKRKEALYVLPLLVFLVPLLGLGWIAGGKKTLGRFHLWRKPAFFFWISGFILFAVGSFRYSQNFRSYDKLLQDIRERVGAETKVLGPNTLWFGWEARRFRDIGSLMYSRWYTGGQRDLSLWLRRWKPDVLIVDEGIKRTFFGRTPVAETLRSQLRVPIEVLDGVSTDVGGSEVFEMYRVKWEPPVP